MNDNRDDELNNQSMGAKSSEAAFKEDLKSTVPALHTPDAVLASVRLQMDKGADAEDLNVETLLAEVQGHLDAEKIDALIDACQRECLRVIVRPFGVGRVLFEDKDGGNVTTTHNFNKGITATDKDKQTYEEWQKRGKMKWQERRKAYDKASKPLRDSAKKPDAAAIVSGYTGKTLEKDKSAHLEHVTPVKEIEIDPGRNLRMTLDERTALANSPHNTTHCEAHINSRSAQIDGLSAKHDKDLMVWFHSLSDEEQKKLSLDEKRIREAYRQSKRHIAKEDAKAWIKKDGVEIVSTGVSEGGKMALQQALGVLLEEFVRASFEEIRDVWKNGFKGAVDDAFLDVLKARLMRVAKRIQSKWKDAVYALRDGFFSGFLSNLVTVLINTFARTLKRYVRMIREGFMSLYRATKTLAFPNEGVSKAEAADAALKIIAAGLVTAGGIAIEGALAPYLEPLQAFDPLSEIVLAASVGLVTGLATACTVYWLDKADLFGVQEKANKQKVIERLTATIQISHERALEAATMFDGPQLPHLP